MPTQYIEVVPKKIKVVQNGHLDPSRPVSAAMVITWVRPNELQEVIKGELNPLQLTGANTLEQFPTATVEELQKNQLLKAKAIGRSFIKVEIIVALSPGVLHNVFAQLFASAYGLLSFSNPVISGLAGLSKKALKDDIKSNKVVSLGQGAALYDADHPAHEMRLPLKTSQPLVALWGLDDEFDPTGEEEMTDPPLLLAEGQPNGEVVLALNTIVT